MLLMNQSLDKASCSPGRFRPGPPRIYKPPSGGFFILDWVISYYWGMISLSKFLGPLSFVGLLMLSNIFMTFAWYAHLKNLSSKPWWIAVFASWAIALLEYAFQVPANRIGFQYFSLGQLKITQEAITLAVFVPFAVFYMGEPFKTDYIWAGLCLLGAVYFMFRG